MVINLEPSVVIELYIKAFLVGVTLGILWDIIRFVKMLCGVEYAGGKEIAGEQKGISRRVFLYILSFLCDVVFWLLLSVASILLFYNVSGGVMRYSVYPCLFSGLALYYFSFGRLTLTLFAALIKLARRIFAFVIRVVAVPMRVVRRAIIFFYHLTIGKIIGKINGVIRERRAKKKAPANVTENDEREEESAYEEGRLYKRDGRIRF